MKSKGKPNQVSKRRAGGFAASLRQGRSGSFRIWERLLWICALAFAVVILVNIASKHASVVELRQQIDEVDRLVEVNRVEH